MKRVIVVITLLVSYIFGFNFNGTWLNRSNTSYNDPIVLEIKNSTVRPVLKRGAKRVALKSKKATKIKNGLYEAWGFGSKNLVLYIRAINNNKIEVIEKKIYTNKKVVYTKKFIFTKKQTPIKLKKRFVGNFVSRSRFSAISRISIREINGQIFVRGWKKRGNQNRPLGVVKAKLYNNRLHITWNRANLSVTATIKGYNYNRKINRFNRLELNLKETNLNNGLSNIQTIQLKRARLIPPPRPIYNQVPRPIYKKFKIGPVDVNLMINSY